MGRRGRVPAPCLCRGVRWKLCEAWVGTVRAVRPVPVRYLRLVRVDGWAWVCGCASSKHRSIPPLSECEWMLHELHRAGPSNQNPRFSDERWTRLTLESTTFVVGAAADAPATTSFQRASLYRGTLFSSAHSRTMGGTRPGRALVADRHPLACRNAHRQAHLVSSPILGRYWRM